MSAIVCSLSFPAAAKGFTAADFLTHDEAAQRSYISIAALTAGIIAARNNPGQAKCIDKWIFEHTSDGFSDVTVAMRTHEEEHPQVIILAVLAKQCGTFKYVE